MHMLYLGYNKDLIMNNQNERSLSMSLKVREIINNPDNLRAGDRVLMNISRLTAGHLDKPEKNVIVAYLLYKVSLNGCMEMKYGEELFKKLNLDEELEYAVKDAVDEALWSKLVVECKEYNAEAFASAIFSHKVDEYSGRHNFYSTSDSISRLAMSILAIGTNDSVIDACSGIGNFLTKAAMSVPEASYSGCELDVTISVISKIRAELLGTDIEIKNGDVFALTEDEMNHKYDKVFSNYPFGMRLRDLGEGKSYLDKLIEKYPDMSKATSSDWIFNSLLCELISDDGKAIGIMTNGSTWNTIDTPMRKTFIEKGLIESVISLPERMFYGASIATTMVLLSKKGNKRDLRIVDASKIFQPGRRYNEFSDEDIDKIVFAMSHDTEYSKQIPIDVLRKNDYTLSLNRYLNSDVEFENGVPFEDVIKVLTRGAQCGAKELDEISTEEPTSMQYLLLGNIKNGLIDNNLPYIDHIDEKYDKYCLQNNDLIISKNGYPYKVAVAEIKEGKRILANGNMFVIRLDEEKVNPYYLKAFFDSEIGIRSLKSVTVGATIPNIGAKALKQLTIPLPPLEEQNRIADKYQGIMDEIKITELRLEKAKNKLKHIFDEESEA